MSFQKFAHITCDFHFECSHQLLRPDWTAEENERHFGACVRLHGHSYRLAVTLHGPIDPNSGMVVNFTTLKAAVRERVVDRLDHRHLNDLLPDLPTAENLLYWILDQLIPALNPQWLDRVELWETRTSGAYLTHRDIQAYLLEIEQPWGATSRR
jgi:6-pyruvoyltetrahydropterin/6-carboxytetrahydropterin synthase